MGLHSWQTLSATFNSVWQPMSPENDHLFPNHNCSAVAGFTQDIDCDQFNTNHNLELGDRRLSKQAPSQQELVGDTIGIIPAHPNHNTEFITASCHLPGIQLADASAALCLTCQNSTTNVDDDSSTVVSCIVAPDQEKPLSDSVQTLYLQNMELERLLAQQRIKLLCLQQLVHSFSQQQNLPLQQSTAIMNHQTWEPGISMPESLLHTTQTTDQLECTVGLNLVEESKLEDLKVPSPQDYCTGPIMTHTLEPNPAHENFPMILQRLLTDLEKRHPGGTQIASFLPDGLSFIIRDTVEFETQIMPLYFPHMKQFASFRRQLNLYDFQRVGERSRTSQKVAYCHAMFIRDMPQLAKQMRSRKRKRPKSS
jgi:hypothetical protein